MEIENCLLHVGYGYGFTASRRMYSIDLLLHCVPIPLLVTVPNICIRLELQGRIYQPGLSLAWELSVYADIIREEWKQQQLFERVIFIRISTTLLRLPDVCFSYAQYAA